MTLQKWQVVAGLVATVISIFGSALLAGGLAANVMFSRQFDVRMDNFHEKAVPEIRTIIETQIREHEHVAFERYNEDKMALAEKLASIEAHAEDMDVRVRRMEDMLWAIYSDRFGDHVPPRSPGNGYR
jgi:hypothetical protein